MFIVMSQSAKQFTIPILYSNLSSLHTPLPHHGRLSYGRSPRLLWHLGYIVGNKAMDTFSKAEGGVVAFFL